VKVVPTGCAAPETVMLVFNTKETILNSAPPIVIVIPGVIQNVLHIVNSQFDPLAVFPVIVTVGVIKDTIELTALITLLAPIMVENYKGFFAR
jgi:glycerol-3-phosphate responsive antiterminator